MCPVAKAAGDAMGGSTTLTTEAVASSLVGGRGGQGIAHVFTCIIKFKMCVCAFHKVCNSKYKPVKK